MLHYVTMGTKLTADYKLERVPLKGEQTGLEFQKGEHKMPLRKELTGGILVERDRAYGDDWKVKDSFVPSEHSHNEQHLGVWHDKGWWFLKNGEIDKGEVTPLRELFDAPRKLGTVDAGVVQVDLFGDVYDSEVHYYAGEPTLSTDSRVEAKRYRTHHDAGAFGDVYIAQDQRRDREAGFIR
jgi:hypothetical protein